ncbi:MAG: TrmO family methyltransferase [Candidatus Cloacimonetes bacterium]|nr:TrmO family methyltransferase [Candidatus Cloacimonadota bacterium]
MDKTIIVHPIGKVNRTDGKVSIQLEADVTKGLRQLEHFSHVIVLWWADRQDSEEQRSIYETIPPYAPEHLTGVFACRSEYRPNPIAVSVCPIVSVDIDTGTLVVTEIDAYDGTPVLDLKAYFPVIDKVEKPRLPSWLSGWPEFMPENGIGIME